MISDSITSTSTAFNNPSSTIKISEKLRQIFTQLSPSHVKAVQAIKSPTMSNPIVKSKSVLSAIESIEVTTQRISSLTTREQEEIDKANLTQNIRHSVKQFYHRMFLNGEQLPPKIFKELSDFLYEKFISTNDYAKNHHKETRDIIGSHIDEGFSNYRNYYNKEGAKFKSYKKEDNAFLPATQIRTSDGQIYELLNTLNEEQTQELLHQHGVEKFGKIVLGQGSYGKVRLARNIESGEIVVAKKFKSKKASELESKEAAELEIEEFKNIGGGEHLLSMHGYAHTVVSKEDPKTHRNINENKSYILMNFAGIENGTLAARSLSRLEFENPLEAQSKLKIYATQYLTALAELHSKSIYHRDIKPANIMHSSEGIYIVDYGFATQDVRHYRPSTPNYLPPEVQNNIFQYSAEKHDVFGLGLSILTLKLGSYPDLIHDNHLEIDFSGELNSISLTFNKGKCLGLTNNYYIKGNTLDEVIIKMLDDNPSTRPTAQELLQLPYFNN